LREPLASIDPLVAFAVAVAIAPIVTAFYAYVVYPAIVWAAGVMRSWPPLAPMRVWPTVTLTVPVYNNVSTIRSTLERLVALDYPHDKLQLLVLSDASTDGTDEVVKQFADRGVELLRAPVRRGKTAAENAAVTIARGEIIVNVDATVAIPPQALKHLIRAFDDPTVGVASGCDRNFGGTEHGARGGESGYTSYEMLVRQLETRVGSIVGASGCFYGIRRHIRKVALPAGLSWDFASTLVARQQGYRSVNVPAAVCFVPHTAELRLELRRKARTMARGISTLFYFRSLMNPIRYGGFALMLISHKLLRWVPYLIAPASLIALGFLAHRNDIAALILAAIGLSLLGGAASIRYAGSMRSKPFALMGFVLAAMTAGCLAWLDAIRGVRMVTWDPTPRPTVTSG
jgi:cellulose synthase/poly-beta-1,6-N-acetylglucosamine synthase-like glycosyltransferase